MDNRATEDENSRDNGEIGPLPFLLCRVFGCFPARFQKWRVTVTV